MKNVDLNAIVESNVKKVYKSNVAVYASLLAAQPVKVFVSGFVNTPGLYSGYSSDSTLHFIDMAGGISPDKGSYIDILVKRGETVRAHVNLYDFLLNGDMKIMQFYDGDTIIVSARNHYAIFTGDVQNASDFEFQGDSVSLDSMLQMAKPKPGVTSVSIIRTEGTARKSEFFSIDKTAGVVVKSGDLVQVFSDKSTSTILVRVDGAHSGPHAFILPYGAKMSDIMARIIPNQRSNMDAMQLFRASVATRQKEMLNLTLRTLEANVLNTRSSTKDEADLRTKEAELVQKFIEKAKQVNPKGQVTLGSEALAKNTLLEDGDILVIPEISSLVMVHGEVLFPNAVLHKGGADTDYYIAQAGGFNQGADKDHIIVLKPSGAFETASSAKVEAGDEIIVLPKISVKSIEIVKGITTILYQLAVGARALVAF